MRNSTFLIAGALSFAPLGFAAPSENESDFALQINQKVYSFSTSESETTTNGQKSKESSDSIETMPNALEVDVEFRNFHIYLFPTDTDASMGFGYQFNDSMELGVLFDHDKNAVKDGNSSETMGYGLYFEHAIDMPSYVLEYEVSLALSETEQTVIGDAGEKTTGKIKGQAFGIEGRYIQPLAGGFSYVFLVGVESSSVKHDGNGPEIEDMSYSVSPFAVRFDF